MELLLTINGVIFSFIATGIVDWRILPLAGLRRIIGWLDRAPSDNPGFRRSCSRYCADRPEDKSIAGY
ncbi:MAG: hypothetical protein ABFS30_17165 [Pseudomonadota bacterium]